MKLKLLLSLTILSIFNHTSAKVKLTPEVQAFFDSASKTTQEVFAKASKAAQETVNAARTRLEAARQELPVHNAANQEAQLANKETASKFQNVLSFIKNNKTAFAIGATLAVVTYVLYKHRQAASKNAELEKDLTQEVN